MTIIPLSGDCLIVTMERWGVPIQYDHREGLLNTYDQRPEGAVWVGPSTGGTGNLTVDMTYHIHQYTPYPSYTQYNLHNTQYNSSHVTQNIYATE